MLDVAPSELLLVAVVALVVIGPKDLPRVMRTVGNWVGKARGMARHFRSGVDTMMREAELEEMQQKWAAENARILSEHPAGNSYAETTYAENGYDSLPDMSADAPQPELEQKPAAALPSSEPGHP